MSCPVQLLAPHVRIWDSVSLNTLHVIGTGVFDRAVTCVAFSKSVGKLKTAAGSQQVPSRRTHTQASVDL